MVGFIATVIDRVTPTRSLAALCCRPPRAQATSPASGAASLWTRRVPALSKGAPPRPGSDFVRAFADGWWDSIREDQKAGCSGG